MLCTESIAQKVRRELSWAHCQPWDLDNLLRELAAARNRTDISEEELDEIYEMKSEVEERLIRILRTETIADISMMRNNPMELRELKDEIRSKASAAPTAKIRRVMHECANKILDALNMLSEDSAESILSKIEQALRDAEEMLARSSELKSIEIQTVDSDIYCARQALNTMQLKRHLMTVGLPCIAKKRNVEVQNLIDELKQRINAAQTAVNPLVASLEELTKCEREQEKQDNFKKQKDLSILLAQEEQKRLRLHLEQTIKAIERRNATAGESARQFLEYVNLGNADCAKSCLEEIRRRDGGVPPILQNMYGRLLQSSTSMRQI